MWLELIAMIVAGVGVAGVIMTLRFFTKGKLPGWTVPAAIGAGMIVFSVWNEYSWFPRVTAVLPPEVTVVSAPDETQVWRPWSYLFPIHLRFVAFDGTTLKMAEGDSALRQAEAMVVQRWGKTLRIPMAFDCAKGMQAVLVDGAALAADGTLSAATWQATPADDPMQKAACKEQ